MAETEISSLSIKIRTVVSGSEDVRKLRDLMESLRKSCGGAASGMEEVTGASKQAKTEVSETKKETKKAGKEAEKSAGKFGKLYESLKRIAMYRLIRTVLKEIVQGFKEGVSNLYQFSTAMGTDFKSKMDSLATSALYLKNSLGLLAQPIIDLLAPAFDFIVDKIVDAINWLSKFFAIIGGKSTYTKAVKYQTEYAKAAGDSAKAIKAMILGFDEINRLESASSSSGSSADYSSMFEEVALNYKRGESFSMDLGIEINDLLFNWGDLNEEQIAKKVIGGLEEICLGVVGFKIGGIPGAVVGTLIGVLITAIINDAIFDSDGKLESNEVLKMIVSALCGLCGAWLGFVVGGAGGALIGFSVSMAITAKIMDFTPQAGSQYDRKKTYTLIKAAIAGMFGAFILGMYMPGVGPLLGFTIGVALTLQILSINWDDKYGLWSQFEEAGGVDSFNGKNTVSYSTIKTIEEENRKSKGSQGKGDVQAKASGGYVDSGTMFIAGEAGAEFVGTINGKTGVMNADQFAEANRPVENAVYYIGNAIVNAVNSKPVPSVKIGDREIYRAAERGKTLSGVSYVR